MKKIKVAIGLVTIGLSFGSVVHADDCPRNISNTPTIVCDTNNNEGTVYGGPGNDYDFTLDGSINPIKVINMETYSPGRVTPTRNGVSLYGYDENSSDYSNIIVKTIGDVLIAPDGIENPPSGQIINGDSDGIHIDNGNISKIDTELGSETKIQTSNGHITYSVPSFLLPFIPANFPQPPYNDGSDGVVLKADDEVKLLSDADIFIEKDYGVGIAVKATQNALLTIGNKIVTKGEQGMGVVVKAVYGFDQTTMQAYVEPIGESNILLKDNLIISTEGNTALGVVYKPYGERDANENNTTITAGTANISTKGDNSHAIAAAGGASDNTVNHVVLNATTISTEGDNANGVHLSTMKDGVGASTADVKMNTGSVITVSGKDSIGINFLDSTDGDKQGTTGTVTLFGDATIDASGAKAQNPGDGTGKGAAIFTARGSDDVILKDDVRIKGMVDGGDDYDYPDTWVDELIFDNYDSTEQFNYAGSLLEYQNFEDVILKNNTTIYFPENYETPPSQTFQIDETSLLKEQTGGTQTEYTIKADLINNGTIDFRDEVIGDNLIIDGDVTGIGKFLVDVDPDTGESDIITIIGDDRKIDFEVDPKSFVENADPSHIIDLVYATGNINVDASVVTLENGETTYTHDGVTYILFEYDDADKGHVWALGTYDIELQKSYVLKTDLNNNGAVDVGDTITYTITATNTGSLELENVVVTDPKLNASQTCLIVEPTEQCLLSSDYVVTNEDSQDKKVENTANVVSDNTDIVEATNVIELSELLGKYETDYFYHSDINSYSNSNCNDPICEYIEGATGSGSPADVYQTNGQDKSNYKIASIKKLVYDMSGTELVDDDVLETTTEVYNYEIDGEYTGSEIKENYEEGKRVVYEYSYIQTGEVIIKYLEETTDGVLEQSKTVTGFVGDSYNTAELIEDINGYSYVGIREGDTEVGVFGEEPIEIVYYYDKKSSTSSGSAGCIDCFDVVDDPAVVVDTPIDIVPTDEGEVVDVEEEQEPVEPVDTQEETPTPVSDWKLPDDFEPVAPIHLEKGIGLFEKYPTLLPQTGEQGDIYKKVGVVSSNLLLETALPGAETFKLAGSTDTDIHHWLQVLPEIDRGANKYIVLPKKGLVMPVNTVSLSSPEAKSFLGGANENFHNYLQTGAVELPGTSTRGYGEVGNKVIAGHSSFWKQSAGRYKTHFQKIIGTDIGEEVWIYEKNEQGVFTRYVYKITASYNTTKTDVGVLYPTDTRTLTLMTCTPIGGIAGRWIVRAEFVGN